MKRFIAIVFAGILMFSMFAIVAGCSPDGKIKDVTMDSSESGNVTIKNFKVNLKDNVEWTSLSADERTKIAQAGFDRAQKSIQEESIFNYTISGYSTNEGDTANPLAFTYDGATKEMLIIVEGTVSERVAMEPPAE